MTTASSPPATDPNRPTPPVTPAGPLWLALDTSGSTARVALTDDQGNARVADERTSLRHSATLLPLCHELLGRAGITVADVRGIACGSGPGSFTGLRVGMAVAKGLALAFDLPFVLVSSLTALALDLGAAPGGDLLIPCIDAGKGEVYAQLFRRSAAGPVPLGPELRLTPEALATQIKEPGQTPLVGGTGADRHAAALTTLLGPAAVIVGFPGPSAGAIAQLGLQRLRRGERDDLDTAVPSYGRPPDITTPKRPVP
jgi:tRNA threonylcarbamoyladenosine biosynthesis protein TsaB